MRMTRRVRGENEIESEKKEKKEEKYRDNISFKNYK